MAFQIFKHPDSGGSPVDIYLDVASLPVEKPKAEDGDDRKNDPKEDQ